MFVKNTEKKQRPIRPTILMFLLLVSGILFAKYFLVKKEVSKRTKDIKEDIMIVESIIETETIGEEQTVNPDRSHIPSKIKTKENPILQSSQGYF